MLQRSDSASEIAQKRRELERCLLLDARIGFSLEPHSDARIGERT
jgi:hypothetical protein